MRSHEKSLHPCTSRRERVIPLRFSLFFSFRLIFHHSGIVAFFPVRFPARIVWVFPREKRRASLIAWFNFNYLVFINFVYFLIASKTELMSFNQVVTRPSEVTHTWLQNINNDGPSGEKKCLQEEARLQENASLVSEEHVKLTRTIGPFNNLPIG